MCILALFSTYFCLYRSDYSLESPQPLIESFANIPFFPS
jgi:hypothetical protein